MSGDLDGRGAVPHGQRRARLRPPLWLWILIAVPAGGLVWLRSADRTGDAGLTNFLTLALVVLAVVLFLAWFTLLSGHSRLLRLGTPLAILGAVLGGRLLLRVEGYSGALVPRFALRYGGQEVLPMPSAAAAAAASAAGAPAVDLSHTTPDDFPGFLGAQRDALVAHVQLARDWSMHPPVQLWRQPIGSGWGGFAAVNGCAVTLEQRGAQQLVSAYAVRSGAVLWFHAWPGRFEHMLGGPGPRSTPLIDDGLVYALGVDGKLWCLDGASGGLVWALDLLEAYGVSAEQEQAQINYGRSNSPLVVGGLLIVPAGGNPGHQANLLALDKKTGLRVWEGPARQISFSSPRLATLCGISQVLIVNEETLSGHDPASGRLLWEYPWPGVTSANASVSQAVSVPPDRVFVSKGYGLGAALLQLVPGEGGALRAEKIWHERGVLRTKFTNVVMMGAHVYGLSDGILECVELATGRRVWKHGRYGHGQILGVGSLLLVLSEEGELLLIDPQPAEPDKVLGSIQVLEGQTWNNLALYGRVLLVRNSREAAAYELPASGP